MKKVILTLLVFVFSFAFIKAQEKTEKETIKHECKMDKKECKADCKFEDQNRGHKNFKQYTKIQGKKLHMRQNGHKMFRNGVMTQDTTKSVHMNRKVMLERRSHMKREHTKRDRGQMEHMKKRMEVEEVKNDGTWTKDNMYNLPMDEFTKYIQYKE